MQPLIDGDVLVYELGFSSEREEEGVIIPSSWEFVQDLIKSKIDFICGQVEATQPPKIYVTSNRYIQQQLNKRRKWSGEPEKDFIPIFRETLAVTKPYKSGRKLEKPFHYKNILAHFLSAYDTEVSEDGLEADDLMCITQYNSKPDTTIICSRDKDLRMCPGWHYTWECGNQPSIGPYFVEGVGVLEKIEETKKREDGTEYKSVKYFGTGDKFFYYQLLVGDAVDSIPGLKGKGPVYAYNLLKDLKTRTELFDAVKREYVAQMGEDWLTYMKEQANLLWMVRELEDNKPVFFKPPNR